MTTKTAKTITVGTRVQAGKPGTEDHDTGRVLALDGTTATVGWDSGVRTDIDVADLTLANEEPEGIRVFQGSATKQIDTNGAHANQALWYWEPADYDGDLLWSDGYPTREAAVQAAGQAVVED